MAINPTCTPACAPNVAVPLPVGPSLPPPVEAIASGHEDCDGAVAQNVSLRVEAHIPAGTVIYTRPCPAGEFDHTILCEPDGTLVVAVFSYDVNTGVPSISYYNMQGTPYEGDTTLLTRCSASAESDLVEWCNDGADVTQWIVKENGEPNGDVYWTDSAGAVIPAPVAGPLLLRGTCNAGAQMQAITNVTCYKVIGPNAWGGVIGQRLQRIEIALIPDLSLGVETDPVRGRRYWMNISAGNVIPVGIEDMTGTVLLGTIPVVPTEIVPCSEVDAEPLLGCVQTNTYYNRDVSDGLELSLDNGVTWAPYTLSTVVPEVAGPAGTMRLRFPFNTQGTYTPYTLDLSGDIANSSFPNGSFIVINGVPGNTITNAFNIDLGNLPIGDNTIEIWHSEVPAVGEDFSVDTATVYWVQATTRQVSVNLLFDTDGNYQSQEIREADGTLVTLGVNETLRLGDCVEPDIYAYPYTHCGDIGTVAIESSINLAQNGDFEIISGGTGVASIAEAFTTGYLAADDVIAEAIADGEGKWAYFDIDAGPVTGGVGAGIAPIGNYSIAVAADPTGYVNYFYRVTAYLETGKKYTIKFKYAALTGPFNIRASLGAAWADLNEPTGAGNWLESYTVVTYNGPSGYHAISMHADGSAGSVAFGIDDIIVSESLSEQQAGNGPSSVKVDSVVEAHIASIVRTFGCNDDRRDTLLREAAQYLHGIEQTNPYSAFQAGPVPICVENPVETFNTWLMREQFTIEGPQLVTQGVEYSLDGVFWSNDAPEGVIRMGACNFPAEIDGQYFGPVAVCVTDAGGVKSNWYTREHITFGNIDGGVNTSTTEWSEDGVVWGVPAPAGTVTAGTCPVDTYIGDICYANFTTDALTGGVDTGLVVTVSNVGPDNITVVVASPTATNVGATLGSGGGAAITGPTNPAASTITLTPAPSRPFTINMTNLPGVIVALDNLNPIPDAVGGDWDLVGDTVTPNAGSSVGSMSFPAGTSVISFDHLGNVAGGTVFNSIEFQGEVETAYGMQNEFGVVMYRDRTTNAVVVFDADTRVVECTTAPLVSPYDSYRTTVLDLAANYTLVPGLNMVSWTARNRNSTNGTFRVNGGAVLPFDTGETISSGGIEEQDGILLDTVNFVPGNGRIRLTVMRRV